MRDTHNLKLRAQMLMAQDRHELAEEQLRLALAQDSSDAMCHSLLALCLAHRKAWDEATKEAGEAISSSPDSDFAHYALAVIYRDRNRLTEARTAIQEALRLDPTDADYHGTLASIEAHAEQWKDCAAAAEAGLAFDPENQLCGNLRAAALTKLGRREEAGQSINENLRRDPENAFTHANEGWRLLHARNPTKAMEHFREALRLRPDMEYARDGIIEAMKARFIFYRWMLSFFLWVGRFPPRVQLGLMIGLPILQNVLQSTLKAIPSMSWLSGPLLIAWCLFIWLTWSSSSLMELVLLCSRFGRLALNRREKVRASLTGLCVLSGVLVSSWHWVLSYEMPEFWLRGVPNALLFWGLTIPVQSIFFTNEVGRSRLAIAYALAVTGAVIWANVLLLRLPPLYADVVNQSETMLERAAAEAATGNAAPLSENSAAIRTAVDEFKAGLKGTQAENDTEQSRDSDLNANARLDLAKQKLSTLLPGFSESMAALAKLEAAVKRHASAFTVAVWMIAIGTWLGMGIQRTPVRF